MLLFPRLVACLATAWLLLAPAAQAQRQAPQDGPVPGPVALARFKASPATGDAPLTVRFSDHSIGSLTSWHWDFGDGSTSTQREPTHVYTAGGFYTVRLTVSGPGGRDVVEKPDGIVVRRCIPGNARDNRATPLERGEDFVPITGDDGLGFYCVYSGKGVPGGPGIANNVGIFLFPLENGEVLVFGSGYGDPNAIVTPTEDSAFDARRIDEILRFCLGRMPSGTPLRFVAPHGHIDHINADLLRELRARGYPVVDIVFHNADAPLVRSLPGWTDADRALYHPLRNTTGQCQEELLSYPSPLGKIWFYLREGHTAGSIDLVIDVRNDPGNRFVVRGSGAAFGTCPLPGVREAIEPHGNMALHAPQPKLLACGPNSASSLGGTTVVLLGLDFAANLAGPPSVLFDGVAASAVTVLDDATITCVAPPGIPGDLVRVSLINRNGQTSLDGFRYRKVPTVEAVTPARGLASGGTPVTVTGSGFLDDAPGTNLVTFRGVAASAVQVLDDRTLTCMTPPNAAGLARVAVSNVNGSAERIGAFRYDPLIDVVSVSPATGSALGGTLVQISGSAFAIGASVPEVSFGARPATEVVRVSDTRLTCRTPSGPGGTNVDVRVSGENGVDVLPGGFRYFLEPKVTAVDPGDGPAAGGTLVTLTGSQFTKNNAGANSVSFGGVPATNVVAVSDTRLTCRVPPGAAGTLADVVVANANGSGRLPAGYRYRRAPVPLTVDPPLGPRGGGTSVTVRGSGFAENGAAPLQVLFGGVAAQALVVVDDGTLTCVVPAGAADGAVDLALANANGSGLLPRAFRYLTRPVLSGIDPASGPGDRATRVTLQGSGFRALGAGVTGVRFGGREADLVRVLDDGTVTCRAPLGLAPGSVDVRLVNENGSALLPAAFRTLAAPSLLTVTPNVGAVAGGDRVVLLGAAFLPGPVSVSFGGNAASAVSVLGDGRLECTTPPGANGAVEVAVRTPGGTARLLAGFVYGSSAPTLTSVSPESGPSQGGTPVQLRGTNFSAQRAGPSTVTFGGHAATAVVAQNDGLLSCLAPPGAPGTRVDVRVENGNGVALLRAAYRYHLQPTLTSVTPSVGSPLGGLLVTLRGSGFLADQASAHAVRFGTEAAGEVQVLDDATLTCRVPPGAPGSLVDLELTCSNGSARLAGAFRYREAPVLTAIAPVTGPLAGGTLVTLSGTGFAVGGAAVTSVRFGTTPASGLTIVNDTTLTCLAPAGSGAGSVDVRVSNGNGSSSLTGAYRYLAAPGLTSLAPASGPAAGGTVVVLSGSGFLTDVPGPNSVLFGGLPATSVTTVDDTRVRATAPAGSAGTRVDVTLTNANGSASLALAFRYHAAPRIDSFDPAGGRAAGGTLVTLHGAGFAADAAGPNSVLLDGNAATAVSVLNDTTLTCQVPAGSGAAVVSLSNRNGSAVAGSLFAYFPPPRLDELLPPQGFSGGGTLVELRGAGWLANGAGPNTVRFGSALASEVSVLDDATLRCRTPAGLAGPVSVQVDNANGTSVLLDGYYYDWAPTLTGILPAQGSSLGGTEVTLSGGGFNTVGAGPLAVRFGAALATNVRVQGGGSVLCTAPPGPAGSLVNVVVSNSRGSSLLSGFRYHPRPSITSIDPAVGPPEGGTQVTLRGTGFTANGAGAPLVRFGATSAASVTVVDDTTLRCTAPAGPARTSATVSLSNANGSGTFVDGFRWMLREASDLNDDGVGDAVLCAGDGVHLFFGASFGLGDESTASADLTLRSSLANTDFGALACSGDLNGDQVPDLVVSAPGDDAAGADAGAVYVFLGPLASSPSARLSGSANAVFRGAGAGDRFGTSLALADLDGDGWRDLAVGAPLNDLGGTDGGAVYVYRGGPSFASQTTAQAAVQLLASGSRHSFGTALGAGDLTGDGVADLAVGAPLEGGSGGSSGVAYVFQGGAALVSAGAGSARAQLLGEGSGDHFGTSVLVADFDGDGTGDLFVGAPDAKSAGVQGGLLYAFRGGATLVSGSAAGANARLEPESSGDRLAQVLAAGDANDDGRMDILVGAPQHDVPAGNGGRAYLLLGGPVTSGPVALRAGLILLSENSSGDQFGTGLGFSDLDGDGRADLLVGSPFSNGGGADSGRTHVFFGAALQATRSAGADDVTFTGGVAGLQLGRAIAGP